MSELKIKLKKDFDYSKKKIIETKKFIYTHLNDTKNLLLALRNNISLLNYSEKYNDYFEENEITLFKEILNYKPEMLGLFVKKLFKNFDQIYQNLIKNFNEIKNEIGKIETSVFTLTEKYKQSGLNMDILYNNTIYLNEVNTQDDETEYMFCFLVYINELIKKIDRMY